MYLPLLIHMYRVADANHFLPENIGANLNLLLSCSAVSAVLDEQGSQERDQADIDVEQFIVCPYQAICLLCRAFCLFLCLNLPIYMRGKVICKSLPSSLSFVNNRLGFRLPVPADLCVPAVPDPVPGLPDFWFCQGMFCIQQLNPWTDLIFKGDSFAFHSQIFGQS